MRRTRAAILVCLFRLFRLFQRAHRPTCNDGAPPASVQEDPPATPVAIEGKKEKKETRSSERKKERKANKNKEKKEKETAAEAAAEAAAAAASGAAAGSQDGSNLISAFEPQSGHKKLKLFTHL
eukprot:4253080-Prymnesium_polylepis.1